MPPRPCQSVTVIVRSHNDRPFVEKTLRALLDQDCDLPVDILSGDDASTDGTAEAIAQLFPTVRRATRPDGPYIPGRTLNHLVRQATGDIIVFNNADAIPQNPQFLRNLIAPLRSGQADATYANQLPRPDATWLVRKDSLRAFGDGSIARSWGFFFSLASSAALRDDLLANPFDETFQYSEDVEWARRRPLRIAYCPDALVEHSHNYTFAELRKRFRGEGYAEAQRSGHVPSLARTLLGACRETLRDAAFLLRHPQGLAELSAAFPRRWLQRNSFRQGGLDFLRGHHA